MSKFKSSKCTKLIAAGLIALGIGFMQKDIAAVSAQLNPFFSVFPEHLGFGIVFPEEQLSRSYEVRFEGTADTEVDYDFVEKKTVGNTYEEKITVTQGNSLSYRVGKDRKPLPDGYDGNDADPTMPNYYRNLCPHLTATAEAGEADDSSSATLNVNDTVDLWSVNFLVPPIDGYVPQSEIGSVLTVPDSGDYGCDLTVEEIPQTTTLTVDLPLDCVSLSSASPDTYSYNSSTGVLTWVFNDVFYSDSLSVTINVEAVAACDPATTVVTYNDSFQDASKSGDETIEEPPQITEEEEGPVLAAVAEIEDPGIGGGQVLGLAATGAESWRFALVGVCLITAGILVNPRWNTRKKAA